MDSRTIHLRRPATLSIQDGVFVPAGNVMEEVDRRWSALCRDNTDYFDGRLCHVLGVHRNGHGGAVLHVMDCAYRFFAVQDDQFDLGVRALGVKGITMHDGLVLMGRRSDCVAAYQGMWEFAPGGSVGPDDDPAKLVQQELLEETGVKPRREPTPIAVLLDAVLRCWELVFRIDAESNVISPQTSEYSEIQWRSPTDLPNILSPVARQVAELL